VRGLRDGAVDLWEPTALSDPPTARSILIAGSDGLLTLDLRPDGRELALVTGTGALRRYQVSLGHENGPASARVVPEREAGRVPAEVWKAAYSPDGRRLAISDSAGTLTLLDLASGQPTVCRTDSPAQPARVGFSGPSLALVAVSDFNSKLRAWRLDDCGSGSASILDPRATVWDFLFTGDGEYLVTVGEDGTLRLWNPATGDDLHVRRVPGQAFNQIDESRGRPAASAPGGGRIGVVTAAWDRDVPSRGRLTGWAIARPAEREGLLHPQAPGGEPLSTDVLLRRARDLAREKPRFPEDQTLSCPGPSNP
jgi:WD40 repeat protein